MKWITRERPKIDRIACPWLIRRFIDPNAEFYFVPANEVLRVAAEIDATPFDIPGVKFGHTGTQCSFDAFVKEFDIRDTAVLKMADIIRGADTDRHYLAKEAAGLWAISAGLAYNYKEDMDLLEQGMIIYDALYSWSKYLHEEKHMQHPGENILADVLQLIQTKSSPTKKIPRWARQIRDIIQDQVDTNFTVSLKEISQALNVHPAYISREFSKYFDDLSFGDYIRKRRIERAIDLLHTSKYTLTEIAYLTGFSDQSHFTRIFKKVTGHNPSTYRKGLKSKKSTNS